MKTLRINCLRYLSDFFSPRGAGKMLRTNLNKIMVAAALAFMCSSFLCASESYALFEDLATHGGKIFSGMREIIYAVSGFGIIAVVIGSLFGNINYKWLTAIVIGLFVIAATASLVNYMVADEIITTEMITDSVISGE